jgi:lipopolysaccharide/colanic/teichoic acid biosynthesis glycosyltransferase
MWRSFYCSIGKRVLDILASFFGLLVLSPLFLGIALLVKGSSKGPVFYVQERVGREFRLFRMLKFRSMVVNNAEKASLVTGAGDARITPIGAWLRRYKLDELPQLWNVLVGDMSLVGPRPEVMRYIQHYRQDYEGILCVRPGITDTAAIAFKDEEAILAQYDNVESAYIQHVLPKKIVLYKAYIESIGFWSDLRLIIRTVFG